jgi:hypothetical protein
MVKAMEDEKARARNDRCNEYSGTQLYMVGRRWGDDSFP